jgi:hypothetical protein
MPGRVEYSYNIGPTRLVYAFISSGPRRSDKDLPVAKAAVQPVSPLPGYTGEANLRTVAANSGQARLDLGSDVRTLRALNELAQFLFN